MNQNIGLSEPVQGIGDDIAATDWRFGLGFLAFMTVATAWVIWMNYPRRKKPSSSAGTRR